MATYAIGDVQGCFDALRALLEEIGFSEARDRLWFVGDLVNRGPQSAEVLRYVMSLGERAVSVYGNHDLHLLMMAEGYGRWNKEDTLDSVLHAPDRDELVSWLRRRPLLHWEGDYVLVHAGLLPQWEVGRARELAAEVEAALQSPQYLHFLAHMYGSEPAAWRDDLAGWDRLRVIVNAMTRLRFCSPEGVMELRAKGPVDKAPPGCMPWFQVPGRRSRGHTLIFGHWSALGFRQEEKLLALDTGCVWGGSLTAVRLEDRKVFQARCPRLIEPTGWQ
ncbi:MAG: symmetrical bis(5'-nucleosyl)-tetraphosphatase [Pseudomonadota bacterium]|jgi:bis(5'-nucleosyl)-tetraphosphatase (symmetrical)